MTGQSDSQSRLSRLVLISAAGLLILGLLTLGLALRNAEAFAREEARSGASITIQSLRANLRLVSILDILEDETRFRIEAGNLLVPKEVKALESGKGSQETEFRIAALRSRMDRVQAQKGLATVLALIEEELVMPKASPIDTLLLQNEGAWRAEKGIEASIDAGIAKGKATGSDLRERRKAFVQAYEDTRRRMREQADAPPIPSAIDLGAFLLRARAGLPAPSWSSELLMKLPWGEREALLDRSADLSPQDFARSQFQNALRSADEIWNRKTLLEEVRSRMGSLLGRKEAWYRVEDRKILLWYPSDATTSGTGQERGEGAWVDQDLLMDRLRGVSSDPQRAALAGLLPMVWSGKLLRQAEAPSAGLPLWEGLWLLPESTVATGLGGQPWFLGLLFVLVFILLIVGLWQILASMKRERAALALRSEFLTSVTHELKTPLSSIRLFTEMLAEGRVENEAKRSEYHRLLAGEAGRLSALVENVLDLGRMERGERSYDLRSEDLLAIVDEAVDLFRPIAEATGMEIHFTKGRGSRFPVLADRAALMQSLLNLLENARKYASSGAVLHLQLDRPDGEARLLIQDEGPGIPAAERDSVFKRFRRGESQKDGSVPGVGLGLYLARRILRAHGGELEAVDPKPGHTGACILLRLPIQETPLTDSSEPKQK